MMGNANVLQGSEVMVSKAAKVRNTHIIIIFDCGFSRHIMELQYPNVNFIWFKKVVV